MEHRFEFAPLTVETAPQGSRPLLKASGDRFGFVPSPVAKAAGSPPLLKHLLAGFAAFDQSSLAPLEREVLALTVAFEIECEYCMAMHSALLSAEVGNEALLGSLRSGAPLADARLEALRRFVRAIVRGRGRVGESESRAFALAGFGEQAALDVLLGTGVYLLSTLANVFTRAEVDAPFAGHAWHKPAAA